MSTAAQETYLVQRLGHLGDGITDEQIYATRCLPGEEIAGEVVGDRIAAPRIIAPSADRVKAPCPHYNSCGGCVLQHASDRFVADWKTEVVKRALAAHDIEAPFRDTLTSPANSRRRAVLSARRGKKGAIVGFHGRKSETISNIEQCQILHADILEALPAIAELTKLGASRKGELSINVTQSGAGCDVAVTGGKPLDRELETQLAQALHQFGFARLSWAGEVIATQSPPFQKMGSANVLPPPGAFLQATHEGEQALVDAVKEIVAGATKLVDLFAGCGTFSLPLAEDAEVHAIEGDAEMMAALDAGWRKSSGLRKVKVETRDLFRNPIHAEDLSPFDAAVIDPPRAGADAQVEQLASSSISRIAMVSCNPVSFARDAKTLIDKGFSVEWVQVVDQFRWSSHVEMVASFAR